MMISLLDFLDEQFEKLKDEPIGVNEKVYNAIHNSRFSDLINNDELCLELIISELDFKNKLSGLNKNRASHILVTWLLGLGFGNTLHINQLLFDDSYQSFGGNYFNRVWLLSSFLHDYGYFCDELSHPELTLVDIQGDYPLLTDDYSEIMGGELKYINGMTHNCFAKNFSYSYEEISNYFDYQRERLSNINGAYGNEKLDHGILGGCIAFRKYCERIQREYNNGLLPSIFEMQIQKIACIISSSHNIFKSTSETDEAYKKFNLLSLLSNSNKRVTADNPFLLLISLVDTIECTKRFSSKVNKKCYLQQKTTLKYIMVDCKENLITIDFTPLYEYISVQKCDFQMLDSLKKHIDNIVTFNEWTSFKTKKEKQFCVSITM